MNGRWIRQMEGFHFRWLPALESSMTIIKFQTENLDENLTDRTHP